LHLIIVIFTIYFLTDAPWGSASLSFITNSTIRHCRIYQCLNYGHATHLSLAQGFPAAKFTQVARSQRMQGGKRRTHWDLPAKQSGSQIPAELEGVGQPVCKSGGWLRLRVPWSFYKGRDVLGAQHQSPCVWPWARGSLLRLCTTRRAKVVPVPDRADKILWLSVLEAASYHL